MNVPTRPSASRVTRHYRSTPSDPVQARAFLQERVRAYLGFAIVIWTIALFGDRLFAMLRLGSLYGAPSQLYLFAHYAAIAVNGVLYLVVRGGERSPALLRTIELGSTLTHALCSATLLSQLPLTTRPEFLAVFAATLFLILRAGLVPGSVVLAHVVGICSVAPAIVLSVVLYRGHEAEYPDATYFTVEWSVLALAATTSVHRVIYGLEERVQELGQYTLLYKIGEGGMGEVYRARHALLRRPTAVKLLPLERTSAAGVSRFEREVQLTAELAHPNIVSVYDFGKSPDGAFYYAMEYLEGIDLQRLVEADGPQPQARVVHLLRQAADALADAHQVGLVHRDVKPANLFLSNPTRRPDHLTVLDFGLATELTGDPSQSSVSELRGTPLYMAPESISGPGNADGRSDIYALGAVAYFLLAGSPPFSGSSAVEVYAAHLHTEPEPPSVRLRAPIARDLEALVLACLAKSPDARPPTASALLERLDALDVGAWSTEQAQKWWQSHPPAPHAPRPPSQGPRTLAVAEHRLSVPDSGRLG